MFCYLPMIVNYYRHFFRILLSSNFGSSFYCYWQLVRKRNYICIKGIRIIESQQPYCIGNVQSTVIWCEVNIKYLVIGQDGFDAYTQIITTDFLNSYARRKKIRKFSYKVNGYWFMIVSYRVMHSLDHNRIFRHFDGSVINCSARSF